MCIISLCTPTGPRTAGTRAREEAAGFTADTGWNHNVLIENNTFEGATDRGLKVGSYTQGGDGFMGISNLTISANTFLPIAGDQTCGISIRNTAGNYPVDNCSSRITRFLSAVGRTSPRSRSTCWLKKWATPGGRFPQTGSTISTTAKSPGIEIQLLTPTEPIGENFLCNTGRQRQHGPLRHPAAERRTTKRYISRGRQVHHVLPGPAPAALAPRA